MSRPSVRGASALALIVCAVAVLPPRGVHAAARPIVPEFMGNVGSAYPADSTSPNLLGVS
jgi:hypothetical protein